MLNIAYLVAGVVVILVVSQSAAVAAFAWQLLRFRRRRASDAQLPKAAVVLSLRGPDPYLTRTLQALQSLDYPEYVIHLIVDSENDPVWEDVQRALESCNTDNVVVRVLRDRPPTCSLKCSALVQAVRELDDDIEIVAFIDGDAVPHASWLRDMATPLSDPTVGVVTGNRWFVPTTSNWGTMVRYFWNVGAVVQVWLNKIVWAGSMALRREVIERTELLDAWSRALSVDATICRQMRAHNLRVEFAPGVMMANREKIGLDKFVEWVKRQLIAAKSCGTNWRLVALHAAALNGTQAAALTLATVGLATGDAAVAAISLAALALYWMSAMLSTVAAEMAVRRILRVNDDRARWPLAAWLVFLPGLALTHVAYCYSLLGAYFQRQVSWRGIEYRIRGVNEIQMREYRPYRLPAELTSESVV